MPSYRPSSAGGNRPCGGSCCGCCCCRPPCPVWAYFRVTKRDSLTGAPLAGAFYVLERDGREAASDLSDPAGGLAFFPLAPGTYTLREVRPPAGYAAEQAVLTVVVSDDGTVTIDGKPAGETVLYNRPLSGLHFPKRSAAGAPLAGAEFTLSDGRTAVSDADGTVDFGPLAPGDYTMTETAAPEGYLANTAVYAVHVAQDGAVTVNGQSLAEFSVEDVPYPDLRFTKTAASSGAPLAGAEFTLSDGRTAVSDADGAGDFGPLPPGRYTMKETAAPAGYAPNDHEYTVLVTADGSILVDGTPLSGFRVENVRQSAELSFQKRDKNAGTPLAGAEFTLSGGRTAVSDADGTVRFDGLAPGTYTLTESRSPDGYLPNPTVYTVVVAPDGTVTIDGKDPAGFVVADTPYPVLKFLKYDASTNAPLAGAEFTLSDGRTAVSQENGLVYFGPVAPGLYTLTESRSPDGYEPNDAEYSVRVQDNGVILIDGIPMAAFSVGNVPLRPVSAPPAVDMVTTASRVITGTGVPGAQITVTFPDGTVATTTVLAMGIWIAPVASGEALRVGDVVEVRQTETGKLPSPPVYAIVQQAE